MTHLSRSASPQASSPPSPQPSSSTTTTLISPSPVKSIGDSRRASLLKSLVKIEDVEEAFGRADTKPKARGNLEPHITNVPRRRKRNNNIIRPALAQEPLDMSPNTPSSFSDRVRSQSLVGTLAEEEQARDNLPLPPALDAVEPHIQLPQIPNTNTPTSAPMLTNLPRRRRKPLTAEQLVIQRAYRRCLQEIGEGSGVFVAFTEVDDEEEQDTRKLRRLGGEEFTYVVKVCTGKHSRVWKEDNRTLWLYVPSDVCYDDGNTHLDEQQLRVGCRFLRIQGGKDKVLITTPRDRAADGMSLAILYLAASKRFVPPIASFIEHPAVSTVTPYPVYMLSRTSSTSSTASQRPESGSPIHALLIYLHDLSCDDLEEAYGHVMTKASRKGGGGSGWKMGSGLRIEWRGTLSREGIDFLDEVLDTLVLEQMQHATI